MIDRGEYLTPTAAKRKQKEGPLARVREKVRRGETSVAQAKGPKAPSREGGRNRQHITPQVPVSGGPAEETLHGPTRHRQSGGSRTILLSMTERRALAHGAGMNDGMTNDRKVHEVF